MGNRVSLTRPIIVRSANGPSNTFLEGEIHTAVSPLGADAVRGVYVSDGVLDGFTIRHGHTRSSGSESEISGGGIYASGGSLQNLRVVGNAGQTAGGAWLDHCSLSNVHFRLNTSETGPRVKINRRVIMTACTIHNGLMPVPDLKILGTNSELIANGDVNLALARGQWFGEHHVSTGTATHVFTITNSGTRPLTLSGIELKGGNIDEFELISAPSGSLLPGETRALTVRFDPKAKGLRRTLIYLRSNDSDDDPYALWLGGEGIQYELMVLGTNNTRIENGSSVPSSENGTDFGACIDRPIRHRFAITNAGVSLLSLTNVPRIVVGGENPGDFVVVTQPSEALDPGDVSVFEIEFYPLIATTRTAEVYIYGDDLFHTNGIYQFSVRGSCAPTNRFLDSMAGIRTAAGTALSWGDYDNDGLLDLAMLGFDGTNRFTDLYRNLGGGSFTNVEAGFVPLESGRLAWGDYDNDGFLDIAMSGVSTSGTVTAIYRNQGDGTFSDINAGLPGTMSGGLAWGDYDNDGDLDLVVSGYTLSTTIARLYRNDGNRFVRANQHLVPLQNGRAAWVDVAKSGWKDLIMTGDSGTGKTTRLYRNDSGVLTNYPVGIRGSAFGGLSAADYNNDGWTDLALTGYGTTGMVSDVYRFSGGAALYARASDSLSPLWLGDSDWGDLNNDGWLDLVTSGEDAASRRSVNVYDNRTGNFVRASTQIPGLRVSGVAMGDADGDGDLDLAVAGLGTSGNVGAVYRNLSPISNMPPSAPTGLTAYLTNGNVLVMRWDGATDDLTSSNSLSYNVHVGTEANPAAIISPHADISTGSRRVVALGNVQYRREMVLNAIPGNTRIVWGVQAVDGSYAGGPFAAGGALDVPAMPDLVLTQMRVFGVPFSASVTVSNRGTAASTAPVSLQVWLNHSADAVCGTDADATNEVGVLDAGETATVVFDDLPSITNAVTNVFRAFVNPPCSPSMLEERYDNNQLSVVYTNRLYEEFWFRAVPLTNDVYLRWIDPVQIGMQSSEVLLRWSNSAFPESTSDGSLIYNGIGTHYHHRGLAEGQPNYYSIWVTHDGVEWIEPP